jgi:hypothetical protein
MLVLCTACSAPPPAGRTESSTTESFSAESSTSDPSTSGAPAEDRTPTAPPEPAATPGPVGTAPASRSADGAPQAPEATALANPQWRPGDEAAAKDTAVAALRDFARPQIPNPQWANDFARWLTPAATADYAGTDPATVPAQAVIGEAVLTTDPANGFGATAAVPTDIGDYTVQLLRRDQDSPWKVHRMYPPDTPPAPTGP